MDTDDWNYRKRRYGLIEAAKDCSFKDDALVRHALQTAELAELALDARIQQLIKESET